MSSCSERSIQTFVFCPSLLPSATKTFIPAALLCTGGNYFRPYLSIPACAIEAQHSNENCSTIWLWFSGGWGERNTWKWKNMGEFLTALSFYYVLVGGVAEHDAKTYGNYIISTFGIKRCKILYFKKHFYRSRKSSQERICQYMIHLCSQLMDY